MSEALIKGVTSHSPKARAESHYEEIVHVNQESDEEEDKETKREVWYMMPNGPEEGSWADSRIVRWFAEFDEKKLRPFLIRNYNVLTAEIEDNF